MSIPIYLSGALRAELWDRVDLFGALLTPEGGNKLPAGVMWGSDTGCFNPKVSARFKLDKYLAWLAGKSPRSCLFATAPDVVGDAPATLARSIEALPAIRALGFPAALVAQDGLENLPVPWSTFDCLFIGGTTDWKLGAGARVLAVEAKRRGKWLHVGRVNSYTRVAYCAEALDADSVDGTFLKYGPAVNLPRLRGWYGCPDCKALVEPDEFGMHPDCPAGAKFTAEVDAKLEKCWKGFLSDRARRRVSNKQSSLFTEADQ